MDEKNELRLVILISACSFIVRMLLTYNQPNLDIEAYQNLLFLSEFKSFGFDDFSSLYDRNLFYNGLILFFSLFLGIENSIRIIPNIFASTLPVIVYMILRSSVRKGAFAGSLIAATIPIFFIDTYNTNSVYSVIIPMLFALVYYMINIRKLNYEIYYIVLLSLSILMHPLVSVFILSLALHMIFIYINRIRQTKEMYDVSIFSIFLYLWSAIIIFKSQMLQYGPSFIWQNTPSQVLSSYFSIQSIGIIIGSFSFLLAVFAVYTVYKNIMRQKDVRINFFMSQLVVIILLLIFNLIKIRIGLLFLSIIVTILFGYYYKSFVEYLEKTKFARFTRIAVITLVALVLLTNLIPLYTGLVSSGKDTVSSEIISALEKMDGSFNGKVVASSPQSSYLVSYYTSSQGILNNDFYAYPDSQSRYDDLITLYDTPFIIDAIRVIREYDINYVFLSDEEAGEYGVQELKTTDAPCIEKLFIGDSTNTSIKIYNTTKCLTDS